ncbi:alpha/beta hydrolase [Cedecea colo]|uniref:Alpha/beta hydrolase n=2 Tax=Cedecea colo TaxID=2552946 RepID=A0ABX0VSS6_9ENTR|nr:alpha/beta hydrolase [Cedecea colo]
MKSIRFTNAEIDMAGNLFLPENFNEAERYPAIVVVHPSGGVKEQTSGLYAQKLAGHGFITLAYDASYQGESSGAPRQLENPYNRVEDISAAIDYLVAQNCIDEQRIGVLGICAGGGYAIHATMMDRRIKALGTVSAVNYGDMYRLGWEGELQPSSSLEPLEMAADQRTAEARGAATGYLPTTPNSREEAPNRDFAEAYEYYRTPRAIHRNAPSKFTTRSLAQLITYDAFSHADVFLTQPLLVIAGSEAGTRWMTEAIYQRAASQKKTIHIVNGATHIAMYDKPDYVAEATDKFAPFFSENL